ncbi:MAG: right-handed parallel beta-helix repeat-containing protein [Candidatus Anstonellales archaeon]
MKAVAFVVFLLLAGMTFAATCTCSDCDSCFEALNNETCDAVQLTQNIDYPSTCIDNPEGFSNKVLDCQGYRIEGKEGAGSGVYVSSKTNVTVKNCVISGFENGIKLEYVNNSSVLNNTVYNNSNAGIYVYYSKSNTISNNTLSNNSVYGIYMIASHYNIVEENKIYGNHELGINLVYSNNNEIRNNEIQTTSIAILPFWSDSNTFESNIINNSGYGFDLQVGTQNTFKNNIITHCSQGIRLLYANNTSLINNTLHTNGYGIDVDKSHHNTFTRDSVYDNPIGVIIREDSSNNVFINELFAGASAGTNPTTVSFTHVGSVKLKGISYTQPEPPGYYYIGNKYIIEASNGSVSAELYLNFSYSDSDLGGVDESTLRVSRYSEIDSSWETDTSKFASEYGVDTVNNVVYAKINVFGSIFAPLGLISQNQPPTVTLNEPLNNSYINETSDVEFTFTAVDDSTFVLNCTLYIDNTPTQTKYVVNNTLSSIIVHGLGPGHYRWYVNCSDGELNGISETRDLYIVNVPPVITIVSPANNSLLPSGTKEVTINITTNENAVCQWRPGEDFEFGAGNSFDQTGEKVHLIELFGLDDGENFIFYYRCMDAYGAVSEPAVHVFGVAMPQVGGGGTGEKAHRLYIFPIDSISAKVGEIKNVEIKVKNKGDYTERNVVVELKCPSSLSCGSATIGTLLQGEEKAASIQISGSSVGSFRVDVYAKSDSTSASEDFTFVVRAECMADSECDPNERCVNSICVEKVEEPKPESECMADSECDANERCLDGKCIEISCTCGYVLDHKCIKYECCEDKECGSGKVCINHTCLNAPPKEEKPPEVDQQGPQNPPSSAGQAAQQQEQAGDQGKQEKKEEQPNLIGLVLLVAVGVLILGGAAAYLVMQKKK